MLSFILWPIPEPDRCSLCADQPRHALCIINLNSGEKMELDIYEPHPFIVGEIAQKQPGGFFCFVRGTGIEGYKIAAETIVLSVSVQKAKMNKRFFCNSCRKLLSSETYSGYVLVDLITPEMPIIYSIHDSTSFDVRCYSILVENKTDEKRSEITIIGHYGE